MTTDFIDPRPLQGARILVLDDEPAALASLERVLDSEGAEVFCVESVDQMRTIVELYEVDAAIVDYWLPGEVGTVAMKALRSGPYPCASVMVTGTRDPSLVEDCIADGAYHVLVKPFGLDDLLNEVLGAVRRTRAWRSTISESPTDHVGDRRFRTHGDPLLRQQLDSWKARRLRELVRAAGEVAKKYQLSERETDVFVQVVQGLRNQEIAAKDGIAERTVKFHVGNIMKKTGQKGRSQLILLVFFHCPDGEAAPTREAKEAAKAAAKAPPVDPPTELASPTPAERRPSRTE